MVMLVPLGVLALGAIFAGMVWYGPFFGDHEKLNAFFSLPAHETLAQEHGDETADAHDQGAGSEEGAMPAAAPEGAIFMAPDNEVLSRAHEAPNWAKVSPFVAMVVGFVLAWLFYIVNPALPRRLAQLHRPLYLFLLNKWYFDEIYDWMFVRPAKWLARVLWKKGDGAVIDGAINGVALGIVPRLAQFAGRLQSGYLFHYAFAMVIGITILITWATLSGGAG